MSISKNVPESICDLTSTEIKRGSNNAVMQKELNSFVVAPRWYLHYLALLSVYRKLIIEWLNLLVNLLQIRWLSYDFHPWLRLISCHRFNISKYTVFHVIRCWHSNSFLGQLFLVTRKKKIVLSLATIETRTSSKSWNVTRLSKSPTKMSPNFRNLIRIFLFSQTRRISKNFGKLAFQIQTVLISHWILRIIWTSQNGRIFGFVRGFSWIFGEVWEDFFQ